MIITWYILLLLAHSSKLSRILFLLLGNCAIMPIFLSSANFPCYLFQLTNESSCLKSLEAIHLICLWAYAEFISSLFEHYFYIWLNISGRDLQTRLSPGSCTRNKAPISVVKVWGFFLVGLPKSNLEHLSGFYIVTLGWGGGTFKILILP